jgi:hypothetical protein
MKLTIIPSDNMVHIDGTALPVDCAAVADSQAPGAEVHAVQWNGTAGWIEYGGDDRPPNRTITDIAQFQSVVDAWTNAQAVATAAASAATAATPVVKP